MANLVPNPDRIENNEKGWKSRTFINGFFSILADAVNLLSNTKAEKTDLEKLKLKYYDTGDSLRAERPSPDVGERALVGTPYPGTVWICKQKGQWIDTGVAPTPEELNLAEYTKQVVIDTQFFVPLDFVKQEIDCSAAIESVDIYGITDVIKLATIINTMFGGSMVPTRVILYNETLKKSAILDFGGANYKYIDVWGGRVGMGVDWIKLGDLFLNVSLDKARLTFAPKCYKSATSFPNNIETITARKKFDIAPSIPQPTNDDEPIPLSMFNEVINSKKQSKNLTTEHLFIKQKLNYEPGHNFASDIALDIDAPEKSNIGTKASKMNIFVEETNKYFTAVLSQFPFLLETPDAPKQILFKCRVYNAHPSESVNLTLQFRTKKKGAWHMPTGQTKTIGAEKFEDFSIIFDRGTSPWSDFDSLFDIYGNSSTKAKAESPAWLYFGEVDMFYIGASGDNLRPTLNPALIGKGIVKEQLSDELIEQIESDVKSVSIPTRIRIIIAGSSIPWAQGIFFGSYVAKLAEYLMNKLSNTLFHKKLKYSSTPTEFVNDALFDKNSSRIAGLGQKVTFKLTGNELAICQVKERGSDYGIMRVKADGVVIGTFDNKNAQKMTSETFSGANQVIVQLKHPATYNHQIKVNGTLLNESDIAINTGGYGGTFPANKKAFVFRALDSQGNPVHRIEFRGLGTITNVEVSYSYGRIICYERSTRGQLNDGITNESTYGEGTTAFDPANPSGGLASGMEFRAIDERAFFIHKFTENKERTFEIEIIDGVNPYFNINYVTNRYHDLMNAGIGGWKIKDLINNDKINDFNQFYKWFMPDIIFQESATNDDWAYGARRINRSIGEISKDELAKLNSLEVATIKHNPVTDKYDVGLATGIITAITPFSLTCQEIVLNKQLLDDGVNTSASEIQKGDIVRIGNYYGDNKQVVCREIDSVNSATGVITWLQPIYPEQMLNIETLDELVGKECCIRDLSQYQADYETYIESVRKVSPHCAIRVMTPGLSNYFVRQLWGYDIIHRRLCAKYTNVRAIDVASWIYDFQQGDISGNSKQVITSTGASNYTLQKAGHWQGFKVLVNGIDVYGKDCHIHSGLIYRVDASLNGAALNKTHAYNNYGKAVNIAMSLVFTKNTPAVGDTIEVQYADRVWSSDFCHPNDTGNMLYSEVMEDEFIV